MTQDVFSRSIADLRPESEVPIIEVPVLTPAMEARLALSMVAELRERGVPIRDILVVCRDLDGYEDLLVRAAIRHDIVPTIWTQLRLVETLPYRMCETLCKIFAADLVAFETVVMPLAFGWVPPEPSDEWPLDMSTVREMCHQAPTDAVSIEDWQTRVSEQSWGNDQLLSYLEWVVACPERPSPEELTNILGGVLQRYREYVLPIRKERDGPALLETERAVRAVTRMDDLIERVARTYGQRVESDWSEQSWDRVAGLCESYATQRPGRREHANARALDIIEANDAWGREVPYVIAVGLSAGVWPQQQESLVPVLLQDSVRRGEAGLDQVAPRLGWSGLKDYDQFADTVAAATQGVVLTRHTTGSDGGDRRRSPLLESVPVERVSRSSAVGLLEVERRIPEALESFLPEVDSSEGEVEG